MRSLLKRRKISTKTWRWRIAGAVLLAMVVTVFAMNFISSEREIEHVVERLYGVDDPQFARNMGTVLGPALLEGNRVTDLQNGVQIFPAMLEAIRSAERTVTFENYFTWSGDVGRQFADAFSERAQAGVAVHVLLDAVGSSRMDNDSIQAMRDAGVEVEIYNPVRWYNLGRLNNRSHRKILVVDGKVGFTGGVGIADAWAGNADTPERWRDVHFRVEGPVVAQLQSAFLENWVTANGTVLHGDAYFPPLQPVGGLRAQVFTSSASSGSENARLMYLLSIAAAERTILFEHSYFIPDDLALRQIAEAARRGVKVRVLVPSIVDSQLTRKASRSLWGELLEAGVEISEYQPSLFHVKTMVVDGRWTSVGSTNFDIRSLRTNDEVNLNVYDEAFAARMTAVFEEDAARSRRITLEEWQARSWGEKASDWLSGLTRSQL